MWFQKGRVEPVTDMIVTVRQRTEKAIEHRAKQFLVFVDLRKAYDSVLVKASGLHLES